MTNVALDPIVAALAASLTQKGKQVLVPDAAVDKARAQLRAAAPGDKERLAKDLVAWAFKLNRLGGDFAIQPRIAAAQLALELLGDEQTARDMFASAGLGKDMGEAIGRTPGITRAPQAEQKAGPTVKAVRGLKRS